GSASKPPVIATFRADPASIAKGGMAVLSWAVEEAVEVSIDHGVGKQPASGTAQVSPRESTTYTLTAKGVSGATAMSTAPVMVTAEGGGGTGATPAVEITSFEAAPSSLTRGQASTLTWSVQG